MFEDHDVAADAVVGIGLLLGVDVEGDDVAHGDDDGLGGRQEGLALALDL